MNVVFRADASTGIGAGHVMRCANLAEALRARGSGIRFVSRGLTGNLIEVIRERGFTVDEIAQSEPDDAAATRKSLANGKVDWLVVDHYELDESWERTLRSDASLILAVDDLPSRRHDCDLLLDQNATDRKAGEYAARVPDGCALAIGPRYALLDARFAPARLARNADRTAVRRILISFGGSDPLDITGRALVALSDSAFAGIAVDVVVGINYQHRENLERLAAARPLTTLHGHQPSLLPLLGAADLAVGAGGTTTWERMCLGVPSVVVCIAENQRPGCEYLAARGCIEYCGEASSATVDVIATALRHCIGDEARRRDMTAAGQILVDGLGAQRLAEHMAPTATLDLRLRHAVAGDVHLFFDWVNDAEVRLQSLRTDPVRFSDHSAWFAGRLNRQESSLFVLIAGELPVGQVRFDVIDGWAHVDYSIDRFFRGRGWATQLMSLGMRAMPQGTRFHAAVKPGNPASAAVFTRLGFEEQPELSADGLRVFRHEARTCE